jgi:transposase-like protein
MVVGEWAQHRPSVAMISQEFGIDVITLFNWWKT